MAWNQRSTSDPLPTLPFSYSSAASVEEDCELAFLKLDEGNTGEALKIVDKSLSLHPESLPLLRTQSLIDFHLSLVDDDEVKDEGGDTLMSSEEARRNHLQDAALAAEKALRISPSSIALALLQAKALFLLASEGKDFQNVIELCEKALLIENPTVSFKDMIIVWYLQGSGAANWSEPERIGAAREELRRLMREAEKKMICLGVQKPEEGMMKGFEELNRIQQGKRGKINQAIVDLIHCERMLLCGGDGALDMKARVRDYWIHRMSGEKKKGFMKVGVDKIIEFCRITQKNELAAEVVKEALDFLRSNKAWRYWECSCRGDHRFPDVRLWEKHVASSHVEELPVEMPEQVDSMWAEKIVNGVWKPVAVDKVKDIVAGENGENWWIKLCDKGKLPLSEDTQRTTMLEKIQYLLRLFLDSKCLARVIVVNLVRFTKEKLESLSAGLGVMNSDLYQTPLCICFLEFPELEKLYETLLAVSQSCHLNDPDEKGGVDLDEVLGGEVELGGGEKLLKVGIDDTGTEVMISAAADGGESKLPDDDCFLDWLFMDADTRNIVESWFSLRKRKKEEAREAICVLNTEYGQLRRLGDSKRWWLNYEKVFQAVENEDDMGAKNSKYDPLKRRMRCISHYPEGRELEYEILSNILEYAEITSGGKIFGDDQAFLRSDMRLEIETSVQRAISKQQEELSKEFCVLDVLIMRSVANIKRMWQSIKLLHGYDYQSDFSLLLKSFLRLRLEDLVDEYDKGNANEAKEAFLQELATVGWTRGNPQTCLREDIQGTVCIPEDVQGTTKGCRGDGVT